MKIATIIPIQRGILKGALSYFTALPVEVGSVVEVPVAKRLVPGLVVKVEPADELKTNLRSSKFMMKKVKKILHQHFFTPAFIQACEEVAYYSITPFGSTIEHFVPFNLLSEQLLVTKKSEPVTEAEVITDKPKLRPDRLVLQESDPERLAEYKSLIRGAFAKHESVLLCLPSTSDIERVVPELSRGIDDYVVILHSKLSKKKLIEAWQRAITDPHPLLIIATPNFLSLPRTDIKTLIIDKENSPYYKSNFRPLVDVRYFALVYARLTGARLIYGDLVLRSETIYGAERGDFLGLSPLKYRAFSEAEQILIPIHKAKPTDDKEVKKRFEAISQELLDILVKTSERGEHSILLAGRRGLAPTTVCSDCEQLVTCQNCSTPLTAHSVKNDDGEMENVFICHKCGESEAISDECPHCGSWKLALLGIGIERLEQELNKRLPQANILVLDSDSAKTPKQAKEIVQKFYNSPGSILLGTEMMFYYLIEPVENAVAAGIDSWFSIPNYNMNERILVSLLRLRGLASKKFIIQTRKPDELIFDYCLKGNLLDFYRTELAERERFKYPPFITLIKITIEGDKRRVTNEVEGLKEKLSAYKPSVYEAFTAKTRGKYRLHLLIKLQPELWPSADLHNLLINLPPYYAVDINPESIL